MNSEFISTLYSVGTADSKHIHNSDTRSFREAWKLKSLHFHYLLCKFLYTIFYLLLT